MSQPTARDVLLASAENRLEPRKRVLKAGIIVHNGGEISYDCTILDVSESGVRIRVPRGRAIPAECTIIDIQGRMAHNVTVMWYNWPIAGVRLTASYAIDSSIPEHLKYLRNLWIECATR